MSTYFGCILGTLALAILFRVPKRALPFGTALGLVAFGVYGLTPRLGGSEALAVFLGAFAGALLGELLARRMRMAALVFITPSLLPLVPGLGLYRTMLLFVQGDLGAAGALGAQTLTSMGLISLAVVAATLVMRLVWIFHGAPYGRHAKGPLR